MAFLQKKRMCSSVLPFLYVSTSIVSTNFLYLLHFQHCDSIISPSLFTSYFYRFFVQDKNNIWEWECLFVMSSKSAVNKIRTYSKQSKKNKKCSSHWISGLKLGSYNWRLRHRGTPIQKNGRKEAKGSAIIKLW